MTGWIISSCALILIVLAARLALKKKLRPGLRYCLWLVVLARLLVPMSLFESSMSILNALPDAEIPDEPVIYFDYTLPQEAVGVPDPAPSVVVPLPQTQPQLGTAQIPQTPEVPQVQVPQESAGSGMALTLEEILLSVWVCGMVVCAAILLWSNLRFAARLRRSRVREDVEGYPLRVCSTPCVATPCLLGSTVYLPPEMADPTMRTHALTHELCHHRQGDHIWSVLRCLCLVIHWYNPLVWVCGALSRRDAEVACDEAAIRLLGEDQRTAYGRTLIGMTCLRREASGLLVTATTMVSGKRSLKERITCIARRPRTAVLALIALILVIAAAVGCTFTGAPEDRTPDETTESTAPGETIVPTETTEPAQGTEAPVVSNRPSLANGTMTADDLKDAIVKFGTEITPEDLGVSLGTEAAGGTKVRFDIDRGFYLESSTDNTLILHHDSDLYFGTAINDPHILSYINIFYPSSGFGKLLRAYGKLYRLARIVPVPEDFVQLEYVHLSDLTKYPETDFSSNYFGGGAKIYARAEGTDTVWVVEREYPDICYQMVNTNSLIPLAPTLEDFLYLVQTSQYETIIDQYAYLTGESSNRRHYTIDIADSSFCVTATVDSYQADMPIVFSQLQLSDLRRNKSYDLTNPEDRAAFLTDWADKAE